ncbi:MAG: hypothetical protein IPM92_16600 [Saprospiraceae bacterium]|nr:hypothetical protein [Saprospiraceae bacterium]
MHSKPLPEYKYDKFWLLYTDALEVMTVSSPSTSETNDRLNFGVMITRD